VLGTQGDAGQFRTPRHIIDFIVAVVDPQKDETILDPACGTAGFLISAYKHIMNCGLRIADCGLKGEKSAIKNQQSKIINPLSPDERARLMTNFRGYDIAPDMVRLARANMYLHGFPNPTIHEYDALTSEERWDERCDVILANPPFMTPKGGVRPHNRFSIKAKRSEVLFVDYIAEHLNPGGRAGIIVPEGIIFQGGNAYKQLRRMLVENYLWAVVSLPAGVFNPYSGVKTSILFLDKNMARRASDVLFVKIENDGFDLGAQRRANGKSELPGVLSALKEQYLNMDKQDRQDKNLKSCISCTSMLKVPRARLLESPDVNLSGDRYRVVAARHTGKWPMVKLGEVCEVIAGQSPDGKTYNDRGDGVPFHQGKTEFGDTFLGSAKVWTTAPSRIAKAGDIVMSVRAPVGPVNIVLEKVCIGRGLAAIRPQQSVISDKFTFYLLHGMKDVITGSHGAAFASINRSEIEAIEIPLPPLDEQERIVAELEGYRKVIEGARQILAAYKPTIRIDPDWPVVKLGEVTRTITPPKKIQKSAFGTAGTFPIVDQSKEEIAGWTDEKAATVSSKKPLVVFGDHTCVVKYIDRPFVQGADGIKIIETAGVLLPRFLFFWLHAFPIQADGYNRHYSKLVRYDIPLPPLAVQQKIVAKLEEERKLVEANRELITRMEGKIKDKLAEVWGETGN
jgi:type I restriction enzyme M protein